MKHTLFVSLFVLAVALPTAGCVTAPTPSPITAAEPVNATPPACGDLAAQIAAAEAAKRAALDKGHDAWKAVIPFAVAARYASGKAAANDAEQRLVLLRAEFDRQACVQQG